MEMCHYALRGKGRHMVNVPRCGLHFHTNTGVMAA